MSGHVTEGERVMYNVYIMSGYVTEGEREMYNVYIMSGYVTLCLATEMHWLFRCVGGDSASLNSSVCVNMSLSNADVLVLWEEVHLV
jgi:hypothetical protein